MPHFYPDDSGGPPPTGEVHESNRTFWASEALLQSGGHLIGRAHHAPQIEIGTVWVSDGSEGSKGPLTAVCLEAGFVSILTC